MKSRWENCSVIRATAGGVGVGYVILEGLPKEDGRGGERARDEDGAEDKRPQRVDGEAPADRHAREDGRVDEVVAPVVEDRAAARLQKLEPGELAVAAV